MIKTEFEADAILGLLLLRKNRKLGNRQELNYKYKTNLQIKMLKEVYKITEYPSTETRYNIATILNMQPRSIQIWFQNTRQSSKEIDLPISDTSTSNKKDTTGVIEDNQIDNTNTFLIGKVYNGQYQSYNVSTKKLIEIYLSLRSKDKKKYLFLYETTP